MKKVQKQEEGLSFLDEPLLERMKEVYLKDRLRHGTPNLKTFQSLPSQVKDKLLPYVVESIGRQSYERDGWLDFFAETGHADKVVDIIKERFENRDERIMEYGLGLLEKHGGPLEKEKGLSIIKSNTKKYFWLKNFEYVGDTELKIIQQESPEHLEYLIKLGLASAGSPKCREPRYTLEKCIEVSKYLKSDDNFWSKVEGIAIDTGNMGLLHPNRFTNSSGKDLEAICKKYIEEGDYWKAEETAGLISRKLSGNERRDIVKNKINSLTPKGVEDFYPIFEEADRAGTREGYNLVIDAYSELSPKGRKDPKLIKYLIKTERYGELFKNLEENPVEVSKTIIQEGQSYFHGTEEERRAVAKLAAWYLDRKDFVSARKAFEKIKLHAEANMLKEDVDNQKKYEAVVENLGLRDNPDSMEYIEKLGGVEKLYSVFG